MELWRQHYGQNHKDTGWAVIEANATWGAGLNGCDPLAAARCIAHTTVAV